MREDMKIECVPVGYLECNCYILDIKGKVLVIDPGDEGKKILDKIGKREVVGIVITHHHFDHIGAIQDIVDKYHVEVYDRFNLKEEENKIDVFNIVLSLIPVFNTMRKTSASILDRHDIE